MGHAARRSPRAHVRRLHSTTRRPGTRSSKSRGAGRGLRRGGRPRLPGGGHRHRAVFASGSDIRMLAASTPENVVRDEIRALWEALAAFPAARRGVERPRPRRRLELALSRRHHPCRARRQAGQPRTEDRHHAGRRRRPSGSSAPRLASRHAAPPHRRSRSPPRPPRPGAWWPRSATRRTFRLRALAVAETIAALPRRWRWPRSALWRGAGVALPLAEGLAPREGGLRPGSSRPPMRARASPPSSTSARRSSPGMSGSRPSASSAPAPWAAASRSSRRGGASRVRLMTQRGRGAAGGRRRWARRFGRDVEKGGSSVGGRCDLRPAGRGAPRCGGRCRSGHRGDRRGPRGQAGPCSGRDRGRRPA